MSRRYVTAVLKQHTQDSRQVFIMSFKCRRADKQTADSHRYTLQLQYFLLWVVFGGFQVSELCSGFCICSLRQWRGTRRFECEWSSLFTWMKSTQGLLNTCVCVCVYMKQCWGQFNYRRPEQSPRDLLISSFLLFRCSLSLNICVLVFWWF